MKLDRCFYKKTDFWFGIGLAAVLLIFWSQIGKIKADTAKILPAVIIIASWICCLAIIVKSIFSQSVVKGKSTPKKQVLCLLATLGLSLVILLSCNLIGMYVSLFLTIGIISFAITYMEGTLTWKKVLFAIGYDAIIILVIYLLFGVFLKVATPKGFFI